MVSLFACRSGSGPLAGLPFGAVNRNRQGTGVSGSGRDRSSEAGARASEAESLAKAAWLLCDERHDRPPRGAPAALKHPAAGSDRNKTERQTGQGDRVKVPKHKGSYGDARNPHPACRQGKGQVQPEGSDIIHGSCCMLSQWSAKLCQVCRDGTILKVQFVGARLILTAPLQLEALEMRLELQVGNGGNRGPPVCEIGCSPSA